jgi:hypothetical protein
MLVPSECHMYQSPRRAVRHFFTDILWIMVNNQLRTIDFIYNSFRTSIYQLKKDLGEVSTHIARLSCFVRLLIMLDLLVKMKSHVEVQIKGNARRKTSRKYIQ